MSKEKVTNYNELLVEDKLKPISICNKTYSNTIVEVVFRKE